MVYLDFFLQIFFSDYNDKYDCYLKTRKANEYRKRKFSVLLLLKIIAVYCIFFLQIAFLLVHKFTISIFPPLTTNGIFFFFFNGHAPRYLRS